MPAIHVSVYHGELSIFFVGEIEKDENGFKSLQNSLKSKEVFSTGSLSTVKLAGG